MTDEARRHPDPEMGPPGDLAGRRAGTGDPGRDDDRGSAPSADERAWARYVERLERGPDGGTGLDGLRLNGPVQGFGRLLEKTYRIRMGPEHPAESVVATWKARFPEFWPPGADWVSEPGIEPGQLAALRLRTPGGLVISTGVMVLYADDTSFTVMTPEGMAFAGFNTFGAHRDGDVTVAQIQALIRASDPLFETGMPIIERMEDRQWRRTLTALAAAHGVEGEPVTIQRKLIDPRRQWRQWRNVRHNAMMRSLVAAARSAGRPAARARPPEPPAAHRPAS